MKKSARFRWSGMACLPGILMPYLFSGTVMAASVTQELTLKMNVKAATCTTAVVSAVDLGRQVASNIVAGTVSQPSTLSIDCSSGGSAPDQLTIRLVPERAHPTEGSQGMIQVPGRDDVGYRLQWGDNQVGTKGDGVPMEQDLTLKNPSQASNDVLFDVKPVALPGHTLVPGVANTHVTINVTYS